MGSEAGNVKKVQQVNLKQPAGGLSKWLEVKVVLKWQDPASNSSGRSSKSTSTDSLSARLQSSAVARLQSSAVARLSEPHLPMLHLHPAPSECKVKASSASGSISHAIFSHEGLPWVPDKLCRYLLTCWFSGMPAGGATDIAKGHNLHGAAQMCVSC